jgi:hypothetical protein
MADSRARMTSPEREKPRGSVRRNFHPLGVLFPPELPVPEGRVSRRETAAASRRLPVRFGVAPSAALQTYFRRPRGTTENGSRDFAIG